MASVALSSTCKSAVLKSNMMLNDALWTAGTFLRPHAASCQTQQVRTRYPSWRMWRDVKRRRLVKEYYVQRTCINSIRKNTILPPEVQEIASNEINALPRDTIPYRIKRRCALTSRATGVVHTHRVSRLVWRHLADYNQLSGVIRAKW